MKSLLQTATIFCGISLGQAAIYAQPPVPPRGVIPNQDAPDLKLTEGNLKAVAVTGAFYNAILRASSYRGHLILSKTIVKEGKVIRKKVVDWQSTWLGDGNGGFDNRIAEGTITTIEGDGAAAKTMVDRVNIVENGETKRIFDPIKNVWSEKKQTIGERDMVTVLSQSALAAMLAALAVGIEFEVSNVVTQAEPEQIVVANRTNDFEFAFDAATGHLRVWRIKSTNGETVELQWKELELNQPIATETFKWVLPAGARQVPPEDNERKFDF